MRPVSCLIAALALVAPAPLLAQASAPAAAPSSERRLTPEQIEQVLAEAAKKREASQSGWAPNAVAEAEVEPRRQPHGEVGFSIGTGGYRGAFGTMIYPMGDDGVAAISLDMVDFGKRRFNR